MDKGVSRDETEDDALVVVNPLLERVGDFSRLLAADARDEARFSALRRSETTGRPLTAEDFVKDLERKLGRLVARRATGRKPKPRDAPMLP